MALESVELVTVRHSGSHFAGQLLNCKYIHADRPEIFDLPKPIVLTMRHPKKVAGSWLRNGRELDHRFRLEWENLFKLKEQSGTYWLPIDTEDRDQRLAELGKVLGRELKTDWKPLGIGVKNDTLHKRGMTLNDPWFQTLPLEQFGY